MYHGTTVIQRFGENITMAKRSAENDDAMVEDDYSEAGVELLNSIQCQDTEKVVALLQSGVPAFYQENENGTSALMVAASTGNIALIKLLLESGAPWNALDRKGKCAGDYAVDSGVQEAIDTLVTAGVTAELLFGAMDREAKKAQLIDNPLPTPPPSAMLPAAAAINQLPAGSGEGVTGNYDAHFPAAPGQYLEDRGVRYDGDKLLDSADDAVMMEWETPLMEAHADILLGDNLDMFGDMFGSLSSALTPLVTTPFQTISTSIETNHSVISSSIQQQEPHRRSVLNIGFGMGIIDGALQRRNPGHHTIIEAHPAVYAQMLALEWHLKPNVTIVFGKWQDHIDNIGQFDAVFFDT